MAKKTLFSGSRVLLLRHGQALGNQQGAFIGRRDDPLTELGRQQAQDLARFLDGEDIHHLITSPLKRAANTARPIAARKDLPLEESQDLMEQDFGAWDGLTFEQARTRHPEDYQAWVENARENGPTGGENLNEVTARMAQFWRQLEPRLEPNKTIALVGHGCAFQTLLCFLFGVETRAVWPFQLQNGSLTEFHIIAGKPALSRLSVPANPPGISPD